MGLRRTTFGCVYATDESVAQSSESVRQGFVAECATHDEIVDSVEQQLDFVRRKFHDASRDAVVDPALGSVGSWWLLIPRVRGLWITWMSPVCVTPYLDSVGGFAALLHRQVHERMYIRVRVFRCCTDGGARCLAPAEVQARTFALVLFLVQGGSSHHAPMVVQVE